MQLFDRFGGCWFACFVVAAGFSEALTALHVLNVVVLVVGGAFFGFFMFVVFECSPNGHILQ